MMINTEQVPVKVGDEITVEINGYATQGEGVGRFQGFTVFVPNCLDGETVRTRIELVKKNYARGELIEVLRASPHRVAPGCSLYAQCGGCQLLHLDYPGQLEFKRRRVIEVMERLGGLKEITVHPVIGMPEPWRYRNKVQYPFALDEQGKVVIGCYQQGTHNVVDTRECLIQHDLNSRIMNRIRELVQGMGISIYDERTGQGLLRYVLVKNGFESGEAMVVLVTNGPDFPEGKELGRLLASDFPALKSVVQNINTSTGNVVLGEKNKVLYGEEGIIDRLGELEFKISANSFFQVNPAQTEILYAKALEYAQLTGEERVLDAYCGVGTLTLFMASKAKEVYGIEVIPEAIEDAKENAIRNNADNVVFVMGATEEVLPKLVRIGIDFDVAVVDPPRSGCEERVLQTFAKLKVPRIVYVSCNPSTLARDLKFLVNRGYEVKEIQPVDMFPHTYHVETVALMSRL
jgi:23S rRNA (uracil1939-C5)-methyltransferase